MLTDCDNIKVGDNMSLGKRLRDLRNSRGYTQRELAELLSIANSTLAMYEIDKREPDNKTLGILADFFNVTTDYLLGREQKNSTIAAHRTDNPTDDLPKEALDKIEEFKELMRLKYGKK